MKLEPLPWGIGALVVCGLVLSVKDCGKGEPDKSSVPMPPMSATPPVCQLGNPLYSAMMCEKYKNGR